LACERWCESEAILVKTLHVLLIEEDAGRAESIAGILAQENHNVLPAHGFEEAEEALGLQKFDAVLLAPSCSKQSVGQFTSKLKELDKRGRSAAKTPVLFLGAEQDMLADIDGCVGEPLEPGALLAAIASVRNSETFPLDDAAVMPIFEVEAFKAQVGNDYRLVLELVDLFLGELRSQRLAVEEAITNEYYEQLCRVAHTMKGSLGSLRAHAARVHAEQLEAAAKAQARDRCVQIFESLAQDLDDLEPRLVTLRSECGGR